MSPSYRLFHGFLEVCNCFAPTSTLVTSDNLTGNNPVGSNPASKQTIQCPLPWQSDAPGSGPGAGFGICCTVGQRATLLEPLGVQPVRRVAAAPAQATPKSPKDRFALTVTGCPSSPSAHMGPQLPGALIAHQPPVCAPALAQV